MHVNAEWIKQTCDVDLARQSHICLTHSAKQGAVVYQPSDPIIYNQFPEKFVVQYISVNKWAYWEKRGKQRDPFEGQQNFKQMGGKKDKKLWISFFIPLL